jgi:hypothetical protein
MSAAQKEARDKIMARREQARAAATATIEKVDRNIKAAGDDMKSVGDAAVRKWTGLETKIAGDLQSMKSGIAQKKHDWPDHQRD